MTLLLGACGSGSTPSATPTSSRDLLSFSSASLGTAYVGEVYSGSVSPLGGTGPYSVRLVSGSLPKGLTFTGGASGTISGTPTDAGSATFTLEVSDANLSVKTQTFNLSVAELPPLDFVPVLPNGEIRGETRIPLNLMGPRGVRAARYTWVLPDTAQVTKVESLGGLPAGRPLIFWKQTGHTLVLDFGFRLTPKNASQVAMISLKPANDQPLTLGAVTSGTTSFLLAQDGAGKVLREVKPAAPAQAEGSGSAAQPAGTPGSAPASSDTPPPTTAAPGAPQSSGTTDQGGSAAPADASGTDQASPDDTTDVTDPADDTSTEDTQDEAAPDDSTTNDSSTDPATPSEPAPAGDGK
ncbi:cell ssuface protein containing Ig-like domain protein [Deinococcus irradiatisoli]|uniref:Cell ssuface protein containing Ig-like domain protein n=2 Tax=Deinococcus irradiatisoli TaxID=2202254 RepID=A0A2Z3JE31_9DEIO|nr:cell ssuface protein containing Ig-like domain protein [Deinococcus irradiatisoli]